MATALHGMLLGLAAAVAAVVPRVLESLGELFFWVLAVPALLLTSPLTSILWRLGLMNAPGWFAWPKPAGVALAYALWVAGPFGLAQVVERLSGEPAS